MKQTKSVLLNYGPNEEEAFGQLDSLAKQNILPDNKNEILRRGLHVTICLTQVEKSALLDLLSRQLTLELEEHNPSILRTARSLSYALYASEISKEGLTRATELQTIASNLTMIESLVKIDDKNKQQLIKPAIEELKRRVDRLQQFKPDDSTFEKLRQLMRETSPDGSELKTKNSHRPK